MIVERDGLGDPLPDPVCNKFEIVEAGGFESPVLAVLRGNEAGYRLAFVF